MSDTTVIKSNVLTEAEYTLNLVAQRIVVLAIIEARNQGTLIEAGGLLRIKAIDYKNHFDCTLPTAYESLKSACDSLYESDFKWWNKDEKGKDKFNKSRFVQKVSYVEGGGYIEIMFSNEVIPMITRLGREYTEYELKQIKDLNSTYALRLFELLMQCQNIGKTPQISILDLRNRFGVEENKYKHMCDFKKRVLDSAVKEINDNTNIKVKYEQVKEGRAIVGFIFKFTVKKELKKLVVNITRDASTADMFTIDGLNDKQLGRIARNPAFIADYNHLVSSTSPAGQDPKAWEFEMINRLKKDASQFNKRSIRDYLNY